MLFKIATLLLILASASPTVAASHGLQGARTSKAFFNPSLGQSVSFAVTLPGPGELSAVVLDRDGYIVRSLVRAQESPAGETTLVWNGRDDHGVVVPDEAYSFKIDLQSGTRHWTYFPAQQPARAPQRIAIRSFDPRTGVLSYDLPAPSRVHVQAGSAVLAADGTPDGPVLKTVVDEQPRVGGSVIEQWNGLDEGGTINVPDQPHFVIGIAAAPLPESTVITVGNRSITFLAYVARRKGASVITAHSVHAHHAGLQTLDDITPPMKLSLLDAAWSAADRAWKAGSPPFRVRVTLEGPIGVRFAKNATVVALFLDGKRVQMNAARSSTITLRVSDKLSPGTHVLAVNWIGQHGPVAVNALRLISAAPQLSSR